MDFFSQLLQGKVIQNKKGDKLMLRSGVTLRYRTAYTLWLNGINKRNHTSFDVKIKKILEDKELN